MNITSVSEAVSSASWSTPQASSTTQAWPASSGYEQYYNYYQNVPPPVATTVAATTTTSYQQDYSQAWDEYYKAYYGQSYAAPVTSTTTTQYNPSYSYDQYGYANFSAPPPNYYESGQSTGYEYTQTNVSGSSAYPTYNTAPSTSVPPTTNWSEPPPSFTQPSTYNNALQTYEQSQSYSQPPPIPLGYENSSDPNNMMQGSSEEQPLNEYYEQQSNTQGKYNSKSYDYNSNSNMKTDSVVNPPKETSYLEQFPPPSFGSPIKPISRGRGTSNSRGRPQIPLSRNNFNQSKNSLFNRGAYGSKINDRRQFSGNDFPEDNLQFSNSQSNNNMINRRGNRGAFNANRGRGMEDKGFQHQSVSESWYQEETCDSNQNELNYLQRDYENQEYFDQGFNDNNQYDDGYCDWQENKGHPNLENQNFPKRDFESSNYPRTEVTGQKYSFNNDQRMTTSNIHSRNGGYLSNDRPPFKPSNTERVVRPLMSTPRQPVFRTQNSTLNKPLVKLMDVVVELSVQSPVIQRRQNMIDQWQRDVKELHNRRVPIKLFWPIIKSSLSPEIQKMLVVNSFMQKGSVVCELVIDDIFLVQSKGENEEIAIESASKTLFEILKNKVFVKTCARDAGGDKVPGFCISSNLHGQVSVPDLCKPSDNNSNAFQEEKVDNFTVQPIGQFSDPGIFLVIEPSTNERDQSIASLVATARFNNCIVDYQHEKLPHAPHISSCVITIDGKEIERHEARDYLVAKRQAADRVIAKLKQTRPQITLRLDKAKQVKKEDLKKEESFENSIAMYLQNFANSKDDVLLKFDSDFSSDEKNTLISVASNLNLTFKSEGKNTLFVFKQFSILEMKNRLIGQGYCAQYQLIEKGSDFSCQ